MVPMTRKRGRKFGFWLSEAEMKLLQLLADEDGVKPSDTLRAFVRQRSVEKFGERAYAILRKDKAAA